MKHRSSLEGLKKCPFCIPFGSERMSIFDAEWTVAGLWIAYVTGVQKCVVWWCQDHLTSIAHASAKPYYSGVGAIYIFE